ncbi:MAG: hypothetical protein RLZZ127_1868 [Planctomycetota bacterium]|jgi:SET domain-containing protein
MSYRRISFLDPRIEIRGSTIEGRGMFARTAIPAGTLVIEWGGILMDLPEVLAGKARPLSVIQVNDGRFLVDPAGSDAQPCEYMNHSCDSNLWMSGDVTLSTRRDIAAGEELTCDYALFRNTHWIHDPDYKMVCRCGAARCRGLIGGDDHRLPEVRALYGRNLAPYLLAAPVLETVGA